VNGRLYALENLPPKERAFGTHGIKKMAGYHCQSGYFDEKKNFLLMLGMIL
jgi:hypothetical protein